VPLIPATLPQDPQGARKRPLLFLGAAIAALALIATYLPGLSGPFLFDDQANLLDNPAFQQPLHSWPALREAALSSPSSASGRPLGFLSLAVDVAIFGLSPTR
jgi:protein O-mannosyl-transferase